MARVIWKGHISFGLVQIPVSLHPATEDHELTFHLLDKRDHSPIGYKKVNKRTGEEVGQADIVKAVELDDEYVVLDDADFEKANPQATQTIDIVAFVDAAELEPRYFVKPYYVTPPKKNAKAYAILRETMRRIGKVGIAKVVLRTRQYVAALLVVEDMLVLELLRYASEVRDFAEFELPGADLAQLGVSARELEMASRLVEGLAQRWDPKEYRDEFADDLKAAVEEKARSGQVTAKREVAEDEGAEVIDILSLLRRSVQEAQTSRQKAPKAAAPAKKHPAGKTYAPTGEARQSTQHKATAKKRG